MHLRPASGSAWCTPRIPAMSPRAARLWLFTLMVLPASEAGTLRPKLIVATDAATRSVRSDERFIEEGRPATGSAMALRTFQGRYCRFDVPDGLVLSIEERSDARTVYRLAGRHAQVIVVELKEPTHGKLIFRSLLHSPHAATMGISRAVEYSLSSLPGEYGGYEMWRRQGENAFMARFAYDHVTAGDPERIGSIAAFHADADASPYLIMIAEAASACGHSWARIMGDSFRRLGPGE